jgi:kinesin family protein 5
LLFLGNVINALTSKKPHIPYADSKLTKLLRDTLGGNSKTTLIITCSPSIFNILETISTLKFGKRAKMIKNKPTVNKEYSKSKLKSLWKSATKKIKGLEEQVKFLKDYIKKNIGEVPEFKKSKKNKQENADEEEDNTTSKGAF